MGDEEMKKLLSMSGDSVSIPVKDDYFAPRGWICPKCGTVLSPSTIYCPFCAPARDTKVTCGTGTNNFTDWVKAISKEEYVKE